MVTTTRKRLVSEAIDSWKRQLIDLGGRNTLLYFRDLRRGTLDLSSETESRDGRQPSLLPPAADASKPTDRSLERLLSGRPVRLSQLFPDPEAQSDAARRARAIRAKARENDEERGLETLYLAYGLATWTSERSTATPKAPVLLYRLAMSPIGATAEDFTLQIDDDPQANEALLHLLETDFNINLDADELLADIDESPTAREALLQGFEEACASVRGFSITPRAIMGTSATPSCRWCAISSGRRTRSLLTRCSRRSLATPTRGRSCGDSMRPLIGSLCQRARRPRMNSSY